MWVVKLGGSLWDSPCLMDWLERLVEIPDRVVIVPGGGPFADQVRVGQARWDFDDATAHEMALLAMEQMAMMLCALRPGLVTAADPDAIHGALARGQVPIWLPSRMVLADPAIAADWTVTSDSLAAWLGSRLDVHGLLLVKSAELSPTNANIAGLQRSGVLDAAFDSYAHRLDCPVWVVSRARSDALAAIVNGSEGPALSLAS